MEGCHYYRHGRALNWGHKYYLDDILDLRSNNEDLVAAYEDNPAILADPLYFHYKISDLFCHKFELQSLRSASCCRLLSLPIEILHIIMFKLPVRDNMKLRLTCSQLNEEFHHLPLLFWESRFRVSGEMGFARSICDQQLGSWQDWYFRIQSEMKASPNRMNLRNRKRIWRLAVDMVNLIETAKEPDRVLNGALTPRIPAQRPYSTVSCLALEQDIGGCRELMQRFAYWGERLLEHHIHDVIPSYVFVSNRRLVSGLTFTFGGGPSVDIGYTVGRHSDQMNSVASPKLLWLVSSLLGIEMVTLDVYPH